MVPNEAAIRALFAEVEFDPAMKEELLEEPDIYFSRIGVAVPHDTVREMRTFLTNSFANQAIATQSNWPSAKCTACTISAWSIAAGIVAVGVAGLTSLSTASAVVVSLAAWAGVSQTAALAFVASLGASIVLGVQDVSKEICTWAGLCP